MRKEFSFRQFAFQRFIFMARDKDRSRRFGEPAKFFPVVFVILIIATIYGIYTYVWNSFLVYKFYRRTFSVCCKLK